MCKFSSFLRFKMTAPTVDILEETGFKFVMKILQSFDILQLDNENKH